MGRFSGWGLGVGSLLVSLLMAAPANAALISRSFEFTATTAGPTASHNGSFSFTYDDTTFAASLDAIDFSIGSTDFTTANAAVEHFGPYFILGGASFGLDTIQNGVDDFWLIFVPATNYAENFAYSQVGSGFYSAFGSAVQLRDASTAVPEPATWMMLIGGFGLVGGAMRSRRKAVRFA